MEKLKAPSIDISFVEKGKTVVKRGERGIVMLLVKDKIPVPAINPVAVITANDIPKSFSEPTKEQIELTLLGYENAPKKVLVYCMDIEAEAESQIVEQKYNEALETIETIRFDYLAVPTVQTDGKSEVVANWIKAVRDNKKKKVKAVLPNVAADHEGIINFTMAKCVRTEMVTSKENGSVTKVDTVYTAEQYCARIAGLLAGTPLSISATYAVLPELADCTRLNDLDTPVGQGQLILMHDGEKVKVVRAVNSLVTTTKEKGNSFKKIKIVDAMDLINDDIKKTAEDSYIGKYANGFDNKCVLISSIGTYMKQLIKDDIISDYSVDIDIEAQRKYLEEKGVDTTEMTEEEIKMADTGAKVFLKGGAKILDAMEEITLPFYI